MELVVWPRRLARMAPHIRLRVAWVVGVFAVSWLLLRGAWAMVSGTTGSSAGSGGLAWHEVASLALFGMAIPTFVSCLVTIALGCFFIPALRDQDKYAGLVGRLRWRVMLMAPACALVPGTVLSMLIAIAAHEVAAGPPLKRGVAAPVQPLGFAIAVGVLAAAYAVFFVFGMRAAWRDAKVEAVGPDGTCVGCGYSLAGLEGEIRCPECGLLAV